MRILVCILSILPVACAGAPERPAWWSEPFAYEQLLPQWTAQTASVDVDGTSVVVASTTVRDEGDATVTIERSTDGATLASVRHDDCAVEFDCTDGCHPVTRTWFDDGLVAGYDFLVETGEAWAHFVNEYEGTRYVATYAVLPDGKLDLYAERSWDPDAGQALLLYPANGCGHELTVDAQLRPVRAVGYCNQRLTEEEVFSYGPDGRLASAEMRYGAGAAPVTYTFEWSDAQVRITPSAGAGAMIIVPQGPDVALPEDVVRRARALCEDAP